MSIEATNIQKRNDGYVVDVLGKRGEEFKVHLENRKGNIEIEYIVIPFEDWGIDEFQETIEVRDIAVQYFEEQKGETVVSTCLEMPTQIVQHDSVDNFLNNKS